MHLHGTSRKYFSFLAAAGRSSYSAFNENDVGLVSFPLQSLSSYEASEIWLKHQKPLVVAK